VSTLSTHVLDTSTGAPAAGLRVHLARSSPDGWDPIFETTTDPDGRASLGEVEPGTYRLGFETGEYGNSFYPFVHVVFVVDGRRPHYHVPLLLGAFGYTTYRGS